MYQYIFYYVYYFTHYIVIKYNFPVHVRGGTGVSLTAVVAEAQGRGGGVLRGTAGAAEARGGGGGIPRGTAGAAEAQGVGRGVLEGWQGWRRHEVAAAWHPWGMARARWPRAGDGAGDGAGGGMGKTAQGRETAWEVAQEMVISRELS